MTKAFYTLKELKQIRSFDGFIDPQGQFYPVRPSTLTDEEILRSQASHEGWARNYLKTHQTESLDNIMQKRFAGISALWHLYEQSTYYNQCQTNKDKLVHLLGFICYGHDPDNHHVYTLVPNPFLNGQKTTKQQMDCLFTLYQINQDDLDYLNEIIAQEQIDPFRR